MKRKEAKDILYEWQQSMVKHGVPLDTSKVQALRVAIEVLSKPNYETDTEVRLAVTKRNKEKVVLWDAFGEVEYYPGERMTLAEAKRNWNRMIREERGEI